MIVQGYRKIHTLSLFKLYGELEAQESTMLKDCADLGGPLALITQPPNAKTPQYSYPMDSPCQLPFDNPRQSYEADAEYDDEEEFQNPIALVSQQFNRLPPSSFCKNQQFTKPPFNRNFKPQINHSRYPRNPHHPPQTQSAHHTK